MARGDRCIAENPPTVGGDVGHADVVLELVLPGELAKETIELGRARLEA